MQEGWTVIKRWGAAAALAIVAALSGCAHRGPAEEAKGPYTGPTDPMPKVAADINANNAAIPSLWARHYFAGDIVDDKGKSHFVNAEGILLMLKPRGVRLTANKPGTKIFDLGTDGARYWMSVPFEVDTMWWGYNRNIGKPCARPIPIQPEGIFEVLGVAEFDLANLNRPPVPVMRFDAMADAYVFVWSQPLADRWAATKEVWYDRATKRPTRVLLYDTTGRVVLRAGLEDFQQIEVDGRPKGQWPWLARVYRLSFPESGSKITLSLNEVLLRTEEGIPTERSVAMPDPNKAGVSKVVQIDEDCRQ
jgi:hypothetical protein